MKEENKEIIINTENTEKLQKKRPDHLYKKGESGNPAGRPLGSKNFYTDFKEAIKNIKDKDTGEELTEIKIIEIGMKKMLKGDARFEGLYKDLLDRVYGKPKQEIGVEVNEKPIPIIYVSDNNSIQENSETEQED